MKICYLSNNAIPAKIASSKQTVKLCESFAFHGNEVTLICPDSSIMYRNIFHFYDVINKFRIKKIKYFKNFPLGINYYLFSIISIFVSKKFKPDIYITRNIFTSFLLTIMRNKNILELHHGIETESRLVRLIFKNLKFYNSKYLIKILAITKNVKNYYQKNFDIKNKFLISPSGTSLKSTFNYKHNLNRLNIGYFGSIYKSRGADLFIKLSKIDNGNNYFIYGDIKDYKNIKFKTTNVNLKISSYLNQKSLKKELDKMDIFLMPYTDKITVKGDVGNISNFTSPLKMFDYLASGKTIISSELNVLKDVLKNNQNVIFIKNYGNIYKWKSEINKIKHQKEKRFLISKNNYNLSKIYSMNNKTKIILENI